MPQEFTLNGEDYFDFASEYFAELTRPLETTTCHCCSRSFKQYELRTSELDQKRYCIACTNKLFEIVGGIYQRRE